jgi:hypothetical protein
MAELLLEVEPAADCPNSADLASRLEESFHATLNLRVTYARSPPAPCRVSR